MIKYRLYRASFEYKANQIGHKAFDENGDSFNEVSADEIQDVFLGEMWIDPELIAEFDTEEAAVAALNEETVSTYAVDGYYQKLIVGNLEYVEEQELDDDGEIIQGNGMWFKTEGCRW